MNPYHQLASEYARHFREGKAYPLGGFEAARRPTLPLTAPTALVFSPHPDDECIMGALPLRMLRQAGWRVVNIVVTQGSNRARQAERWEEVQRACKYLGFEWVQTVPNGFERVTTTTRVQERTHWQPMVERTAQILRDHRPLAIFSPHENDWNSAHIGTHFLVRDALLSLGPDIETFLVETEYWGQMSAPNLMVESSVEDLGDVMTALSFHAGEVRRNPFHLLLPAWMQDNVRRGSELVGGQGQAAPNFTFATLYRLRSWRQGSSHAVFTRGRTLAADENPAALFNWTPAREPQL